MAELQQHNEIRVDKLMDLPDDEAKVTEAKDGKLPNTSDFIINKEDHTVANFLRTKLHENSMIRFAAYRVPHPTTHSVIMKIQTGPDKSSKRPVPTPRDALDRAVGQCLDDLEDFERLFVDAVGKIDPAA